jgi:hypothetical protein
VLNYRADYGGGYFLWTGEQGIVIDPGFDFIKNFILANLPVCLIDKVIVTHAHPDHLADVPSLVTLAYEQNEYLASEKAISQHSVLNEGVHGHFAEPGGEVKTLDLYLSLSAYTYLTGILGPTLHSRNYRIHILERGCKYNLADRLYLLTLPTAHADCTSQDYGVGLVLKHRQWPTAFIYTSDTGISDALIHDYAEILRKNHIKSHIMLCNMGGVHQRELGALLFSHGLLSQEGYRVPPPAYRYPSHLGVLGMGSLATVLKPDGLLIGEMGGEMHELRQVFATDLTNELGLPCLIADLGLTVQPFDGQCYALSKNGLQLLAMADVHGVEQGGNIIYISKHVEKTEAIMNSVHYSGADSWRCNLPI